MRTATIANVASLKDEIASIRERRATVPVSSPWYHGWCALEHDAQETLRVMQDKQERTDYDPQSQDPELLRLEQEFSNRAHRAQRAQWWEVAVLVAVIVVACATIVTLTR